MTTWNGLELPPAYYSDDAVYLIHADCREVLPLIPDKSIDLVLTDPPYGVGKADWDNVFSLDWLKDTATLTKNALAIIPGISNLLSLPKRIDGLTYKWTLAVRVINATVRGAIGFGNWIPCVVYVRDGGSIYTQEQDAGEVAIRGIMPEHPCPKPYEAMSWFISRLPGQLILDPFLGSGTTLVCARKLGRKAIGIEIEERYCQIAVERLRQQVMDLNV